MDKQPSLKQLNYIRDIIRKHGTPRFTGKTMAEAREYITQYKNGMPKTDFSKWVYRWYEDYILDKDKYWYGGDYIGLPTYSYTDVLKSVMKEVGYDEESNPDIDYLEELLADGLLPDEKVIYGIYDETEYEYIEDLERWGMDISGHRGED